MGSKDSSSVDGSQDTTTMSSNSTAVATPGPQGNHNSSAQQHVYVNPDPALDISNEHRHPHVHHGQAAVPDEKDDIVFAKASDKYAGDATTTVAAAAPDYKVRQMGSNEDEESGRVGDIDDEDSRPAGRWSFRRLYKKFKIFFHLFIWAVWTA